MPRKPAKKKKTTRSRAEALELRDHIALVALKGSAQHRPINMLTSPEQSDLAEACYEMAEHMLRARELTFEFEADEDEEDEEEEGEDEDEDEDEDEEGDDEGSETQ